MKHLSTVLLTLALLGLMSCKVQQDNEKTFNKTYLVGSVPDIKNFQTYNEHERWLDSFMNSFDKETDSLYRTDTLQLKNDIFKRIDSLKRADTSEMNNPISRKMDSLMHADSSHLIKDMYRKKDFRNNRSRIFMNSYTNDQMNEGDPHKDIGLSTPCECYINNDTLYVNMAFGFFSGGGFKLNVFGKNFEASFFEWTDADNVYKLDLNDTAFYDYVFVKGKYQHLIFNDKPTFKAGQQLTGYLTFTSNNYYENFSEDSFDTSYVTGKLYFTCRTRLKIIWDYR